MAVKGRPSKFTQALADRICERLSAGETLRAVCRDEGMPHERTVRTWALHHETFSPQYAQARETGYATLADEILELADDKTADAKRSRLQVDTRKWLLSKALPKVYGDKLAHEVGGVGGGPVVVTWQPPNS